MILAVIALVIISIFTAGKTIKIAGVDDALGFIITPFQGAVTSVTNWVGDSVNGIIERKNLEEENKELKKQIRGAYVRKRKICRYMRPRTKDFRSCLTLHRNIRIMIRSVRGVIAKDTGVWYDSFLIDKGSIDGIKNNMPVINAGGLVGRVVKTSAAYSNVYSILDTRSSVSVKSARTGDAGVVTGDYELMEQGLCRMEYIDSDAEIVEGDEIITSGLSEYYPEGISVGYVKEIHRRKRTY